MIMQPYESCWGYEFTTKYPLLVTYHRKQRSADNTFANPD